MQGRGGFGIIRMMEKLHELYGRQDIERLETKYRRAKRIAALLGGAALLLCVLFCCLTDRRNAALMERLTVGASVLGGWLLIYLRVNTIADLRHEITHAKMLLEEERTAVEGVLSVSRERMRIRGSIRFFPLTLIEGDERHRSKVIAARAETLRAENGNRLRLYVVNGYVAAFEEL